MTEQDTRQEVEKSLRIQTILVVLFLCFLCAVLGTLLTMAGAGKQLEELSPKTVPSKLKETEKDIRNTSPLPAFLAKNRCHQVAATYEGEFFNCQLPTERLYVNVEKLREEAFAALHNTSNK